MAATPPFTTPLGYPGSLSTSNGASAAGPIPTPQTLPLNLATLQQLQTQWSVPLNNALGLPPINAGVFGKVALASGSNIISVPLGSPIRGWIVADIDAPATINRNASFGIYTPTTLPTLSLNASAACNVILWVF